MFDRSLALDLLRRAQTGDDDARERFLARHEPLIQRLAHRYFEQHRVAVDRAGMTIDDLLQVARIELLATVDRVDPDRGYAELASRRVWKSLQTATRLHRGWLPRPVPLEDVEVAGSAPREGLLERFDLESLSARQREVVALHYWHDMSFAEVARELGIDESTAREHHDRAIERLRETV